MKLNVASPTLPVAWIVPDHFCSPAIPACVAGSSPCENRFEKLSSQPSGSHGQAPTRAAVRFSASTKSESGLGPLLLSGGYSGPGNPFTFTIGPPFGG